MQRIINGGMYSVKFIGGSQAEFSGEHPAIIIRTLKEDEIFIVVPLTTYTKEKMQKARDKGFGYHIKSTNSIARIDKVQIIHKRDILNRWTDIKSNLLLIPSFDEIKELNEKVNEYVSLSTEKEAKEYSKYYYQYNMVFDNLRLIKDSIDTLQKSTVFSLKSKDENAIELTSNKSSFSHLSLPDLKNMFQIFSNEHIIKIEECGDIITVKLSKKMLTT